MENKELLANFYSFVLKNQVKDEALIDDYYQTNKTEENKKELKNACLYAKANIASENNEYEKSICFYKKIINDNLSRDEDENTLLELLMCKNYIHFDKKEAFRLVENYFNKNKEFYDLDFLACYAKMTDKKQMDSFHLNIAKKEFSKLGYKDEFPASYQGFTEVEELYRKESVELGGIYMLEENEEKNRRVNEFVKNSKFKSLISQLTG